MSKLACYQDFLTHVENLGFLFLSDVLPGFPSVSSETEESQWHTGEAETDPWQWKDRAAKEKQLAFGCLLGGHKGFIAPKLYPAFLRACQPDGALEERWAEGSLRPAVWEIWQLFEKQAIWGSNELGKFWKNAGNKSTAGLDSALKELQREFWITVAGNRRKLNRLQQPYGWPHLLYERVDTWAPASWVEIAESLTKKGANAAILSAGQAVAPWMEASQLAKILRLTDWE